jgi:dynein heavy chain
MEDIDDVGKNVFYRCFQQYVELNTDLNKLKHISPVNDIMMVQTLCTILDALLIEHNVALNNLEEEPKKTAYETLFVFACMWAFGGSIGGGQDDEKDQKEFNSFWRSVTKIKFPEAGYAFDYFCEPSKSSWQQWQSMVIPYTHNEDTSFSKINVGTLHTTRLRYLLDRHVLRCKPVLFIGNSGTGKTAVLKDYLASTKPEKISHRTISFNSFTTSFSLQKSIETMVEKKSGKTFGSATNKTLIYFIDDMNMPFVDVYFTQSPIALLNYIVDYGSIFNREQLEERKYL